MRRTTRPARAARALLLVLLASTAVPLASGAPASAQAPPTSGAPPTTAAPIGTAPAPAGSNPAANTWSLSPTGRDPSAPGDRTNFTHELAPGASVDDSLTVWNYSSETRVFDVYARDAFNTEGGGIALLTKDKQSKDLGTWVALSTQQVTVPGGRGVTVPFSITVPRNATPGDHDAGVVASLATAETKPGEQKVVVDHRVGVRMYVRVTGPLRPLLAVEDVQTAYVGTNNPVGRGDLDVSYTVRNAGNIRLKSHQSLDIDGLFGVPLADRTPEDLPELLPGASVRRTEHFTGVLPLIRDTANVSIIPFTPAASGRDAAGAEPVLVSSSTWAVPWTLLLVVGGLIAGWRIRRRLRSRRPAAADHDDAAAPTDPTDPTDPPEGDDVDVDDLWIDLEDSGVAAGSPDGRSATQVRAGSPPS